MWLKMTNSEKAIVIAGINERQEQLAKIERENQAQARKG